MLSIDLMKASKIRPNYAAAAQEIASRIEEQFPRGAEPKSREVYRSEKTGKIYLAQGHYTGVEIRAANYLAKTVRHIDDVWYARILYPGMEMATGFMVCQYGAAPFKLAAVMLRPVLHDFPRAMDLLDFAKLSDNGKAEFWAAFRDHADSQPIGSGKLDERLLREGPRRDDPTPVSPAARRPGL